MSDSSSSHLSLQFYQLKRQRSEKLLPQVDLFSLIPSSADSNHKKTTRLSGSHWALPFLWHILLSNTQRLEDVSYPQDPTNEKTPSVNDNNFPLEKHWP